MHTYWSWRLLVFFARVVPKCLLTTRPGGRGGLMTAPGHRGHPSRAPDVSMECMSTLAPTSCPLLGETSVSPLEQYLRPLQSVCLCPPGATCKTYIHFGETRPNTGQPSLLSPCQLSLAALPSRLDYCCLYPALCPASLKLHFLVFAWQRQHGSVL